MEREDEEIAKLLGEIPIATSALPLHLEDLPKGPSLPPFHPIAFSAEGDSSFNLQMSRPYYGSNAALAKYSNSAPDFYGNLIRQSPACVQEARRQFVQQQHHISSALAKLSLDDGGLQMPGETPNDFNGNTDPQHSLPSLPFDPSPLFSSKESLLHNESTSPLTAQKLQQLSVRSPVLGLGWSSLVQARESDMLLKNHLQMPQLPFQHQELLSDESCRGFGETPNGRLSWDNEASSQQKIDFARQRVHDRHHELLQHVRQQELFLEQSRPFQRPSFQNYHLPVPFSSISSFLPVAMADDGWNLQNPENLLEFAESGNSGRHLGGNSRSYLHSHPYGHGERGHINAMFLEHTLEAKQDNSLGYPCCNTTGIRRTSRGNHSGGRLKNNSANGHLISNGYVDISTPNYTSLTHLMVSEEDGSQNLQGKFSTLEEVEGRICEVAKDQHGCRFLQRKFEEGTPEDVQRIFQEICGHILELMSDPFGNYLIQKLLEVCNDIQRMQILEAVTIKDELVTISLNMHGTRAVQKLIETLKTPEQIRMATSSLRQGVVTLIKDLNGNHVVQRCLQHLCGEDNQFIFDAASTHCVEIASHRHGCCVLQRCIDFASRVQQERLVAEIAANAFVLSQDPFGNYVIQYILELGLPWASLEVITKLESSFPHLSMQKFSSNVVEKCLKIATEDSKAQIVNELISSCLLGRLLQDPYANYVIQSALQVSKGELYSSLVDAIRPYVPALRNSPYGRRILSRTHLRK